MTGMKPTETQRRFRKQMAEIERKNREKGENPLDYHLHRGKSRSFRKAGPGIGGSLLVLMLIVAFVWSVGGKSTDVPLTVNRHIAGPGEHGVPSYEAPVLNALNHNHDRLSAALDRISVYHQVPWEQRDEIGYQQALTDGVTLCAEVESALSGLSVPTKLDALAQMTGEYAALCRQVFVDYLDSIESGRSSDIDRGNRLISDAAHTTTNLQTELLKYLKDNGYKHEVDGTTIWYWYSI